MGPPKASQQGPSRSSPPRDTVQSLVPSGGDPLLRPWSPQLSAARHGARSGAEQARQAWRRRGWRRDSRLTAALAPATGTAVTSAEGCGARVVRPGGEVRAARVPGLRTAEGPSGARCLTRCRIPAGNGARAPNGDAMWRGPWDAVGEAHLSLQRLLWEATELVSKGHGSLVVVASTAPRGRGLRTKRDSPTAVLTLLPRGGGGCG